MHITTLGIDLAKHVFQLHGVDARGRAVLSRRVTRSQLLQAVASLPPCVIGMERAEVHITGSGRLNRLGKRSS